MQLNEMLKVAAEKLASDIHLKVGVAPVLRIDGRLTALQEMGRLSREWMMDTIFAIMNPHQKEQFIKTHDLDMAHSVPGLGRFRVNIYQQRGTVGAVFRVIPMKVLNIRELNLPEIIEDLSLEPRGLILVTGTTGSGKTTTLAGMIDHINSGRNAHVMTIEDPIEYLHRDRMSLLNQREVGFDTNSFATALRHALRQDPDVITINRIISVFPPHQQQQIRLQLATVLEGIISMRLVPRADGRGRVPAVEVLVATTIVRECIIDKERTKEIHDIIADGRSQYGMQTFDQALMDLYDKELITYEEAIKQCTNPDDFSLKIKGIESTDDLTWAKEKDKIGSIAKRRNPGKSPGGFEIDRFSK
jgi:twitching motility protein PilT